MRVAAVQINSTDDYERNLRVAEALVRDAAADGAELVVLPEKWTTLGPPEAIVAAAEPLHGRALTAAGAWARDLGVHLVAGSLPEKVEGRSKPFNTSVLIGPDGVRRAVYRKIHMFDVDIGNVAYRESESEDPGSEEVVSDVDGVPIGLTICYDLRFPELYRVLALRDARVITVPAAFTERTGRDHWEVLLRARAIENQLFVIAAGQVGDAPPHFRSYGRSMIVDPWGVVLAQAPDTECFISAELDFRVQDEMRSSLPALRNRRPDAYRWPQPKQPQGPPAVTPDPLSAEDRTERHAMTAADARAAAEADAEAMAEANGAPGSKEGQTPVRASEDDPVPGGPMPSQWVLP